MGTRVFVYWNINKKLFSVRKGSRVQKHVEIVRLREVSFKVGEAGRLKVLESRHKNVHAGLRGEWCSDRKTVRVRGWRRITYDPYRFSSFVTLNDSKPVTRADEVIGIAIDGRARLYAKGLEFA